MSGRELVHPRFERGGELIDLGRLGPLGARRRHHAGAQLANHLLRDIETGRRRVDVVALEVQIPAKLTRIVAVCAEVLDDI